MQTLSLTKDQAEHLVSHLRQVCQSASRLHKIQLPSYEIAFDIKGTAWGYYVRKGDHCAIRLNPALCALHFDETLNHVIPHEVAHFVVDCLYRRRCKPHGPEWRNVMLSLGVETPSATHRKDVSRLAVRRQQRHGYHCGCQTYWLTTTRHNRISTGKQQYLCRRCGSTLVYCADNPSQDP